MSGILEELETRLRDLEARSLRRTLAAPSGRDFCSNDYLALSHHPHITARVREALGTHPAGAPASRLLRGNTEFHEALERRLAAFKGTEAALLFPSGFQANLAVLSALASPRDRVVTDRLNHASVIDGLRLARCRKVIIPHLDIAAADRALGEPHAGGRTFLVTESLFSMDGDIAPLDRYADLTERHGASLIVDDAHATGLYGRRGSGLTEEYEVERRTLVTISTFGKAFGLHGACVAGPRVVIDYLVNRSRPFVFSTAPAPLMVAAIEGALDVIESEPERRRTLHARADRMRRLLREQGLDCRKSAGPIIPVMIGDNQRALRVAALVQADGFDVRAIRPPTVEPGTARLRISVHSDHTDAEIDALAASIGGAMSHAS